MNDIRKETVMSATILRSHDWQCLIIDRVTTSSNNNMSTLALSTNVEGYLQSKNKEVHKQNKQSKQ